MLKDLQIPAEKRQLSITSDYEDLTRMQKLDEEIEDRRLYLYGSIGSLLDEVEIDNLYYYESSKTAKIIDYIMKFNREDEGIDPKERRPIRLYINSPGGDVCEGFALIDVMKLSQTPIYTVNVGEWCSMAFLIGITGAKRFSLPSATFMMHEPSGLTVGKFSDMADKVIFNKKYACKVIKKHILKHSKMSPAKYGSVSKKDFYMLADEALKYGFIDEIIDELETIF